MKRQKMGTKESNKTFKKNAGSKSRNFNTNPMRGGIRL